MNKRTRVVVNDEGDEVEILIPFRWEICQRCKGNGTHSNPAIDGNGITMEEWWGPDWDDDSREAYMNGDYDVQCSECQGSGKLEVEDYGQLTPEDRAALESHDRAIADLRAAEAAEARYFARFER